MISSKQTFFWDNELLYAAGQNYYMSKWKNASTATAMNADNLIDLGMVYDGRELTDGEHLILPDFYYRFTEIIDEVFSQ